MSTGSVFSLMSAADRERLRKMSETAKSTSTACHSQPHTSDISSSDVSAVKPHLLATPTAPVTQSEPRKSSPAQKPALGDTAIDGKSIYNVAPLIRTA